MSEDLRRKPNTYLVDSKGNKIPVYAQSFKASDMSKEDLDLIMNAEIPEECKQWDFECDENHKPNIMLDRKKCTEEDFEKMYLGQHEEGNRS